MIYKQQMWLILKRLWNIPARGLEWCYILKYWTTMINIQWTHLLASKHCIILTKQMIRWSIMEEWPKCNQHMHSYEKVLHKFSVICYTHACYNLVAKVLCSIFFCYFTFFYRLYVDIFLVRFSYSFDINSWKLAM